MDFKLINVIYHQNVKNVNKLLVKHQQKQLISYLQWRTCEDQVLL